MRPIVAMALFCDSVRREIGGSDSVVGVMPDNAHVPNFPGVIPRIAIYFRVQLDPESSIESMSFFLKTPEGARIDLGPVDGDLVRKVPIDAKTMGLPFGT